MKNECFFKSGSMWILGSLIVVSAIFLSGFWCFKNQCDTHISRIEKIAKDMKFIQDCCSREKVVEPAFSLKGLEKEIIMEKMQEIIEGNEK